MKFHALNGEAWDYMEAHKETFWRLSEERLVCLLHDLRGTTAPQDVLE